MDSVASTVEVLGNGAYTVADARRLTGVPDLKIRRWLTGRNRTYQGESIYDPPLLSASYPLFEESLHLSFRDLIELRMVDRFRRERLSMPYLRKVVRAAQELVGDDHPFSTSKFKTDGRRLYLEMLSRTEEPKLVEVLSGQHTFHSIISVGLKDVDFRDGVAALWRPAAGLGEVVVDPQRSFGQPILARYGVPTGTLAAIRRSGRSVRDIARDFEINEKALRAALAFEGQLDA
jgi:uncharacterized protein (DUF433 family)